MCYKYNKPIRSAIFNFNKLVPDLDIDTRFWNHESKKYAKIRNRSNQNQNPDLKTKIGKKNTNITNIQNTKRTYGQPSEQLLPKRWPLSNRNRIKII